MAVAASPASMRRVVAAALIFAPAFLGSNVSAADETPPVAGALSSDAPEHHGSAYADPLGFLMFGPRIGVDAGGAHLTGGIYGRWFDPGLLGRSLFLKDGDRFAFSYGVGVRGRYYFGAGHGGFHLGAGAEFLHTRVENSPQMVATISGYIVPQAEGGYRFAFERFYAGGAVALGYAARLSGRVENLPGGSSAGSYQANNESSLYGSASLELGVFF
jgi:hypothetical protein